MGELLYCTNPKCDQRADQVIDYENEVVGICILHAQVLLVSFPSMRDHVQPLEGLFQIPQGWVRIVQRKVAKSPDGISAPVNVGANIPRVVGRKKT